MRWSIRYRLFVPLGLLLLGVVGISTYSALAAARQAEERIARQVKSVTHTLAGANISLTPRIVEQMKGLSGADYLYIDAEGNRISSLRPEIELPDGVLHQSADDGETDPLGLPVEIDGTLYRCRRLPQRSGGDLYILYPETSLQEATRDAVRPAVIFGLFGGSAAVALMYLIGQRLVGRIQDLKRRTQQIAAGDFSPMPLPRQHDELRDLARSINEMAERLALFQNKVRSAEQMRLLGQLSSGLAHQLRNSVTGAKLAIQLFEQGDTSEDREALQVALRQLNLMEANLRRFMDLGKQGGAVRARCHLADLVEEALALLRPQARHAAVEIVYAPPHAAVEIQGDPVQWRDILLNLIGNAIEVAGPNGQVEIVLGREKQNIHLEVLDTGPGPPPAIADVLFEPFVTSKREGIGLGLAVTRHAVEMHGGRIGWRRTGERTVFRVDVDSNE